jgi:apolipoprotein N-acyltransferase
VPFGEYMPLRPLLQALGAPVDLVPKDAIAGTEPAVLDVPAGRVGVVISWEVFFADRGRDAIANGGRVLLNPTNGSSYTGTVLQTQQIASSRLRAIETGRWVAQAAPTGFSAFLTPDGEVTQRTAISEARVITETVSQRTGRTWYVVLGDHPWGLMASVVLLVAIVADTRSRGRRLARGTAELSGSGSQVDDHRGGPIVDDLHGHGGSEAPGGDIEAEAP